MVLGKAAGLKLIRQGSDYQYILIANAGKLSALPGLGATLKKPGNTPLFSLLGWLALLIHAGYQGRQQRRFAQLQAFTLIVYGGLFNQIISDFCGKPYEFIKGIAKLE